MSGDLTFSNAVPIKDPFTANEMVARPEDDEAEEDDDEMAEEEEEE